MTDRVPGGFLYRPDVITEAETFTARLRTSGSSVFSLESDTSTIDAAPSPVGQHISSVFG